MLPALLFSLSIKIVFGDVNDIYCGRRKDFACMYNNMSEKCVCVRILVRKRRNRVK